MNRNKKPAKSKEQLDEELEEGLAETFPASDPPAVIQPEGHAKIDRKR
jgi:hypothetical protein